MAKFLKRVIKIFTVYLPFKSSWITSHFGIFIYGAFTISLMRKEKNWVLYPKPISDKKKKTGIASFMPFLFYNANGYS